MGSVEQHPPVLLLLAAFSRYPMAIEWAGRRAEREWGPIALASPLFEFRETRYYESTMGPDVQKLFFAFEKLADAAQLVSWKHAANGWEEEFRQLHDLPEPRPLNLDPGYITEAKLVLATTKDRDHRLYLERGIYAEVTLVFQQRQWMARPWTYPDYRRADYHQFFTRCRDYLRQRAWPREGSVR
jgi:hypothetical protein